MEDGSRYEIPPGIDYHLVSAGRPDYTTWYPWAVRGSLFSHPKKDIENQKIKKTSFGQKVSMI
jgi:hypothetical protein